MINTDGGQLYTIEGFAAALIMVITAFLVLNATSVYTAGDTHINDMQLEALGTDALKMMDVAPNGTTSTTTPLQQIIEDGDWPRFDTEFSKIINHGHSRTQTTIHYNATFICRNNDDSTHPKFYHFKPQPYRRGTFRESDQMGDCECKTLAVDYE